ncbi:MAG: efflux RND transporter periplasmic adaptor subunit [Alphaproteobacteria bacterium]|nr:efflux RND transporter periplasmic adaptor subunit [Alphaproteobacteria bacterium]
MKRFRRSAGFPLSAWFMGSRLTRLSFAVATFGAILAGAIYLGPSLFSDDAAPEGKGARGAAVVTAQPVAKHVFIDSIEALGTAIANESVTVTAKITEIVSSVGFDDGDTVERGAILVELGRAEELADLSSARADLDEATKQFDRIEDLARRGAVSQARLDQERARRDAARGRVGAVEARLADRLIRAPFAGVLGLRLVSPGTLVRPGDVITTLDDVSVIKVDFTVPERFLSTLAPGLRIEAFSAAYPGQAFEGTVSSVDSRVDPVSRSVIVRAVVPNEERRLRPGMLLSVTLVRDEKLALSLPEGALLSIRDQSFVFRVKSDQTVERVDVTTGLREPGLVEIVKGLSEGDLIVVEGTNKIRPGVSVTLAPPEGTVDAAGKDGPT